MVEPDVWFHHWSLQKLSFNSHNLPVTFRSSIISHLFIFEFILDN